jgi:hypothetical protein
MTEFWQKLTRIIVEHSRARGEEERPFDSAILGAERAPAELAVIMDCFAKLDRTTIGGSLARWVSTQKIFLYGDTKISFEYLTSETGQGEARITIQNVHHPFETKGQTITMWPGYSNERHFIWKGKFPEDRELPSVDVAFYVLTRLSGIEKRKRTKSAAASHLGEIRFKPHTDSTSEVDHPTYRGSSLHTMR